MYPTIQIYRYPDRSSIKLFDSSSSNSIHAFHLPRRRFVRQGTARLKKREPRSLLRPRGQIVVVRSLRYFAAVTQAAAKSRAGCSDPRPPIWVRRRDLTRARCVRVYVPTCARRIMRRARACPRFRSAPAASMPVRCAPDRKSIDRADSSRSRTRFDSVGRQRLSLSLSLSSRVRRLGPF